MVFGSGDFVAISGAKTRMEQTFWTVSVMGWPIAAVAVFQAALPNTPLPFQQPDHAAKPLDLLIQPVADCRTLPGAFDVGMGKLL